MERTRTTTTRKITRFEIPENLPDDPKVLKALLGEVCATAQHEIDDLLAQIASLRSPRPSAPAIDPNQTLFPFAQPPTDAPAPPAMEPAAGDAPAGKGHGRRPWPENLPREREEIAPPADAMKCRGCGGELTRIGEEVTPEVEYKPASYFIRQIVRPKFACVPCQGNVVIADLPPRPILKGRPGPGMLSHVVVAKYEWHQPLERQAAIMKSAGVDIAPTTLDGWIGAMADTEGTFRPPRYLPLNSWKIFSDPMRFHLRRSPTIARSTSGAVRFPPRSPRLLPQPCGPRSTQRST